jgi:hypothetical protein
MTECPICGGFNSHFKQLQPSIREYKISKHFPKDIKNSEEIMKNILACEHTCFSELHKFEKKIDDLTIFRAKIDGAHIVYAINSKKVLFFLRAFENFRDYTKFLENDKQIKNMADSLL